MRLKCYGLESGKWQVVRGRQTCIHKQDRKLLALAGAKNFSWESSHVSKVTPIVGG